MSEKTTVNKSLSESLNSRSLLNGVTKAAFLALAVLIAACNNPVKDSTPVAIYKSALEAGKKGDVEGYRRGFSQATLRQHDEAAKARGQTLEQFYNQVNDPKTPLPAMRNEKIEGNNATIEIRADWVVHRWMVLPFIKENGEWKVATADRPKDVKLLDE